MTTEFEEIDVAETEELSPEEVEERDVFSSDVVDTVNSPLLDFFLGQGLSQGGRQR